MYPATRQTAGAGAGGVTWVAERMTAGASGTSLKSWLASWPQAMTGATVTAAAVRAGPSADGRTVTLDAPVHPVIAVAVRTASTSLRRCLIGCRHLSCAWKDVTCRDRALRSSRAHR